MPTNVDKWINGVFEHPFQNVGGTVGGNSQVVYVGQKHEKTYTFACKEEFTGLYAVADGIANAIPTLGGGGTIQAAGLNIHIELRATVSDHVVRTGYWIDDNPVHSRADYGIAGSTSLQLPVGESLTIYDSDTLGIFRFSSPDFPTGLWVATEIGEFPIPSQPTNIDIEAMRLTIVSRSNLSRRVAWRNIS
jgi:hypothetical protein